MRSSHVEATPRSGGIAIFIAWALLLLICSVTYPFFSYADSFVFPNGFIALLLSSSLAFALGVFDDRYTLPARYKLVLQVFAAAIFVVLFGGLKHITLPLIGATELGAFGIAIGIFWIVALMNAFNFMDGLNGIAGIAAILVLASLAIVCAGIGAFALAMVSGGLCFAITGFAWSNFPKGKIFLGDGGSLFIAFVIAILALLATNAQEIFATEKRISALFVPIAFMPFLFDVAFTLVHRSMRGQTVFDAHREHIYQLLTDLGVSHVGVTSLYVVMTLLCCGVALCMENLPFQYQWIAAIALAIIFLFPSVLIFRRALRGKLLK